MCLINSNLGYVYNGFHVRGPNYYKQKPDQVRNRDTQEPGPEVGAGADTQRPSFNQQPSGPVSGYKTELGEKLPPSVSFFLVSDFPQDPESFFSVAGDCLVRSWSVICNDWWCIVWWGFYFASLQICAMMTYDWRGSPESGGC